MVKKWLFTLVLLIILTNGFVFLGSVPSVLALATPSENSLQSPDFTFKLTPIINPNIPTEKWAQGGINYFFERAIAIMATSVGIITVMMMSVGGFLMILSHGDQDQYNKGKGYITKAAIGLAAVLGAYLLVTTVQLLIRSIYG